MKQKKSYDLPRSPFQGIGGSYFKTAFRNIKRHKTFSVINIAGLAIGIASCLLIFTVVKYELSYDTFQPGYKQVYRLVTQKKYTNDITYSAGVAIPALNAIRIDFPEVTTGAILSSDGSQVTVLGAGKSSTSGDKKFIEESGFFYADPQFFKVFHYDWLIGDPSVLKEPNNTVLTQKMATKYFGNWRDAPGKYLKLDNAAIVKVAGILKDPPANSDFPLRMVTSLETAKANADYYDYKEDWGRTSSSFQLFMLIPKNVSVKNIDQQLLAFSKKNYHSNNKIITNFLQPLSEIHFDKRFSNFGDHLASKTILWTLSLIGLFILIMACINFINLSTAQAVSRSKEIGIRKVLGSYRSQLFRQIISETAFIVFASVILAISIATACLPCIKNVAAMPVTPNLFSLSTILFLLILCIVVIFFAGTYPAFILSGFKPVQALKNKITSATIGGISIRRSLVVLQFAISQILIIGTIVAITQMSFVKNADLGFNQDAILLFRANADSAFHAREDAFKQKIVQLTGVQSVSFCSDVPSSDNSWSTGFAYDHKPEEDFHVSLKIADEDYFKTFGLQFLAGKPYDKSDTIKDLVINETLLKKIGVNDPNVAIGKEIQLYGGSYTIAGVVKDFKTSSLRDAVQPIVIAEQKDYYGVTSVKLHTSNLPKAKAAIESAWNQYFPEYAFATSFMDENIAQFYQQEDQLELLYKIFAGIAIFISCLGLYGLVSFMAVQKTKEIGVRKVLGASVKNIIYLFSKEFTVLILIGSVIAIPVAWYMMNHWLQNFAFRIKMNAGIFIMAILISIIIAWIAVGYKSVKAALVNPVKSLRTE